MSIITTYTFHDARDHSIVAQTSDVAVTSDTSFPAVCKNIAERFKDQGTRRFYVHNGSGVVAALMTRDGNPTQVLHQDYRGFSAKAITARSECGIN